MIPQVADAFSLQQQQSQAAATLEKPEIEDTTTKHSNFPTEGSRSIDDTLSMASHMLAMPIWIHNVIFNSPRRSPTISDSAPTLSRSPAKRPEILETSNMTALEPEAGWIITDSTDSESLPDHSNDELCAADALTEHDCTESQTKSEVEECASANQTENQLVAQDPANRTRTHLQSLEAHFVKWALSLLRMKHWYIGFKHNQADQSHLQPADDEDECKSESDVASVQELPFLKPEEDQAYERYQWRLGDSHDEQVKLVSILAHWSLEQGAREPSGWAMRNFVEKLRRLHVGEPKMEFSADYAYRDSLTLLEFHKVVMGGPIPGDDQRVAKLV